MNVADRIQSLRKMKGVSQEQLADAIGVSRQAVSKWESEQSMPDMEKVILMSDYFDVTTDYILKGIEPTKETEHMTVGDVIDKRLLTDTNGKRVKKILQYLFYVLIGVFAVDAISFVLYVIIHGFPM
ncbi:MAG: helix-turn-helix domain-containing protein [Lachnospiraceae bacterium]